MSRAGEKYRALLRLARDQAGKPEGDTASAIAARMLLSDPGLESDAHEDREPERREIRYKSETDYHALLWSFRFVGVEPLQYVKSRAKVIVGEDSPSMLDAVEEAYHSVRHRLEEVVGYAIAGFLQGAMPLRSKRKSSPSDQRPDPELLEAARSAAAAGRSVSIRKAIGSGEG